MVWSITVPIGGLISDSFLSYTNLALILVFTVRNINLTLSFISGNYSMALLTCATSFNTNCFCWLSPTPSLKMIILWGNVPLFELANLAIAFSIIYCNF